MTRNKTHYNYAQFEKARLLCGRKVEENTLYTITTEFVSCNNCLNKIHTEDSIEQFERLRQEAKFTPKE